MLPFPYLASIRGTAVITGGSRGIGAAYACELARAGFKLVLVARTREATETMIEANGLPDDTEIIAADLGTSEGLSEIQSRVSQSDVCIVVNNAGVGHYKRLSEISDQKLGELLSVNVQVPIILSRIALINFIEQERGAIINMSSTLAFSAGLRRHRKSPYRATYIASRALVATFTQVLSMEIDNPNIRVQVCCPGRTTSGFHRDAMEQPGQEAVSRAEMSPTDVVKASLAALEAGEVCCIPSLRGERPFASLLEAEERLLASANHPRLADRYAYQYMGLRF